MQLRIRFFKSKYNTLDLLSVQAYKERSWAPLQFCIRNAIQDFTNELHYTTNMASKSITNFISNVNLIFARKLYNKRYNLRTQRQN